MSSSVEAARAALAGLFRKALRAPCRTRVIAPRPHVGSGLPPGVPGKSDCRRKNSAPGFTLITQNVDGLHDLAGSKNMIKLHGAIWVLRCLGCGRERVDRAALSKLPPYSGCGAMMRPGVVWFGEMLPDGRDGTGCGSGAAGRCGDCSGDLGTGLSGLLVILLQLSAVPRLLSSFRDLVSYWLVWFRAVGAVCANAPNPPTKFLKDRSFPQWRKKNLTAANRT
jgi:hypothetical protein